MTEYDAWGEPIAETVGDPRHRDETKAEQERNELVVDVIGWDDRKQLADIWQQHAPLPTEGLSERVYDALLAVATHGARQAAERIRD